MLFPIREAGKFVALQTPFAFMQHTGHGSALGGQGQDQGDTGPHLRSRHGRCPFFSPDAFPSRRTTWQ